MSSNQIKIIFASLIVVLAIILSQSLESLKTVKILIGANQWIGYESLHLSDQRGELESHNFQVMEFKNASYLIKAFERNLIDVAALTIDEAIILSQNVDDLVIIFALDVSSGGDAIVTLNEKLDIKDLRNHRVGVEEYAVGHYLLSRAAELNQIDLKEINIVPLTIDRHLEAIKNDKVDFLCTFNPVVEEVVNHGGKIVFNSKNIPNEIVDVLVVRRSLLNQNEKKFQSLISILMDKMERLAQRQPAIINEVANRNGVDTRTVIKQLEDISIPIGKENLNVLNRLKESVLNRVTRYLVFSGRFKKERLNLDVDVTVLENGLMMRHQ
ncbi:MAG: hypothetical protein OHK0056_09200 [Bacteriovoracaceae bacterium]